MCEAIVFASEEHRPLSPSHSWPTTMTLILHSSNPSLVERLLMMTLALPPGSWCESRKILPGKALPRLLGKKKDLSSKFSSALFILFTNLDSNNEQSIEQHETLLAELLGFLLVTSLQKKEPRPSASTRIWPRTSRMVNVSVLQLWQPVTAQEQSIKTEAFDH